MKRILSVILAALWAIFFIGETRGASFADETLHYVVSYKWGLIHKEAGDATLSLRRVGDRYDVMLSAKTRPWADRFYRMRDTLSGSMRVKDLRPTVYRKITHEKGKYSRDVVDYTITGNTTLGKAKRYRLRDGKMTVTEQTLSATGPAYDMLSVFYFLRNLNFDTLTSGKVVRAAVFSGSKKETISIRCLGREEVKMPGGAKREAYHIRFRFTRNGGRKSSDDIDAWISTDAAHVPLSVVGKLPVGQVRAYLK